MKEVKMSGLVPTDIISLLAMGGIAVAKDFELEVNEWVEAYVRSTLLQRKIFDSREIKQLEPKKYKMVIVIIPIVDETTDFPKR